MKQNTNNLPKRLPFQNNVINQAGPGRAAGSTNYVNHVTGEGLDLFQGQVVQVGPIFALLTIAGNEALSKVRVDHALLNGSGPILLGDTLIVGPLDFLATGPRARAAWPSRAEVQHRPGTCGVQPRGGTAIPTYRQRPVSKLHRNRGTVTRVAPTGAFGQVTDQRNGAQYFVHHSALQRGAMLRIGARVSYTPARNPQGLLALLVQRD